MRRITRAAGLAGLFIVFQASFAAAQTVTTNRAGFGIPAFNYEAVASQGPLTSYTDSNGTIFNISTNKPFSFFNPFGLLFNSSSSGTLHWTLSAPVDHFGFDLPPVSSAISFTGVTLSNGHSKTFNQPLGGGSFLGFSDTTTFNTIDVTFINLVGTLVLSDYRVASAPVPEPSSLVSGGLLAFVVCGAAVRRYVRSTRGNAQNADVESL